MVTASSTPMIDFKVLYYPARCLIQHHDPYQENEVLHVYQAEAGHSQLDSSKVLQIVSRYLYLPSAFPITGLFALLPWQAAHLIWLTLTMGSLCFASFLIWDLGADYAPVLSGLLVAFFLINSGDVVALSNAAGIATALCAIAIWCFVRDRWTVAGALCLAVSLALKPQDAGLVWLFLLLAGGAYRKHAIRTLIAVLAIGLPGLLWVNHVAPNWMQEWHSNILAFSVRGGLNDPGPASTGRYGFGMMVSLPILFSYLKDDPSFYNPASSLTTAAAFVALLSFALRYRLQQYRPWLAIAATAALAMLPVYHRQQDTKLLLLSIPACAMLWAVGGPIAKWLGLLVNVVGLILTGDILWILLDVVFKAHLSMNVRIFPVPIILLTMSIFYVGVHAGYSLKGRRLEPV
ncbi:MAG TPA: hypothetical protein VHD85_19465 [Terracidiphilus sp.]|nr:hypothetical protein [Terracidiphilus sp.]